MAVIDMTSFEQSTTVSTLDIEKASFLVSSTVVDAKKEKGCCKENKCELVDYHSLPNFMKHNEFILDYYRSEWPLKQAIFSIFSIHNETLNVWTHLIGFFVFLALITCTTMIVPINESTTSPPLQQHLTTHHEQSISRWPFYTYLCGAMFCMLMSSACHLLACHSEHTCYVMLRLDYAGISALIVTSFYPLVYYSFACDPFFQALYIGFITFFGIATVVASLAPVFDTPEFRFVRAGLFACMGVSGLVPILHKAVAFGHRPEAVLTTGYEMVMGLFYGLGVVVYVARVPERWLPGKFDLAGHSHQLFHVLVIAGAYTHYLAGLVYLSWREAEGC